MKLKTYIENNIIELTEETERIDIKENYKNYLLGQLYTLREIRKICETRRRY